jgi:hypothetical protein
MLAQDINAQARIAVKRSGAAIARSIRYFRKRFSIADIRPEDDR